MIKVPENWTVQTDYRKHNDEMARRYPEALRDFNRELDDARRHLRMAERRRSPEATCSDLRAAVESLMGAIVALAAQKQTNGAHT